MDAILASHEQLEKRSNLGKTLLDIQSAIDLLQDARSAMLETPESSPLIMAKLKQPFKTSFDKLEDDLKDVNKGLNQYQKALDKKFKRSFLPTASTGPLVEQPQLINRAILMHLLREGNFEVANIFERESWEEGRARSTGDVEMDKSWTGIMHDSGTKERDWLQQHFAKMYTILHALRRQHDLEPAIQWARDHSTLLEQRGSNLEFELSRLKFIELYTSRDIMSDSPWHGQLQALQYAQIVFQNFGPRYTKDVSKLLCSLAYAPHLEASPYHNLFFNESAWEEASTSFTREFCGLLGLSEQSPLYTAVTAGGIALPVLEKLERIVAETGGQWTSPNELPVETPLPRTYKFHSIFVCPVSKEQATDDNPPMMLPCGHVIAQQSLDAHSRGKNRMKCPYCPAECAPKDAKRLFI